MPIPVPIPGGPLPVTAAENARVEDFVARVTQLIKYGSSGLLVSGKPAADKTTIPDGNNPTVLTPLSLDSEKLQLFYRQLAFAIEQALVPYASSTVAGITRLSTDPTTPSVPVALNSEEVTTVPSPNKVPRALPSGVLDPGWITGVPGGPITVTTFTGVCVAGDAVGDLMYVTGPGKTVAKSDITDFTKTPVVGCIVSKPTATSCIIQTAGLVSSVYTGLTAGKIYVVGTNSRPALALPVPAPSTSLFLQQIGIAVDTNLLLISPASQLTMIRG